MKFFPERPRQTDPNAPSILKRSLFYLDTRARQLRDAESGIQRKFSTVVFGHPYHAFDRDQLMAFYFARKAGLISYDADIIFSKKPSIEQIDAKDTLVLEGVPTATDQSAQQLAKTEVFVNGPNDEPAASMLFQRHQRDILKDPNAKSKLMDLHNWVKAVETGKLDELQLTSIPKERLDIITNLFYGLKLSYPDPEDAVQLLLACEEMIDQIISSKPLERIKTQYVEPLAKIETKKRQDREKIERLLLQPEAVRTTETQTGLILALVDMRGLGVEAGTVHAVQTKTNADIVIIVDTQTDDEGKEIGTQFLMKIPKEKMNDEKVGKLNLRELLAERLSQSEMLFGKGFQLASETGFDGHPGVIGSPAFEGSALAPQDLWVALQRFFDVPRYTKEQFSARAKEIAQKVGTEQFLDAVLVPPLDRYSLPEWHMRLNIPNDAAESEVIDVSESDLRFYEEILSENTQVNHYLLRQKTALSEPQIIREAREKKAQKQLETYIQQRDPLHALLVIDDINVASIRSFPFELRLQLLELIQGDEKSINHIWNANDSLFRITQNLPDWIENEMKSYKQERYNFVSVPRKIDQELIESLIADISRTPEGNALDRIGSTLIAILMSETYKRSHTEVAFDQLLASILKICTSPTLLRSSTREWMKIVTDEYGASFAHHWKKIDPHTLVRVQELFPEEWKQLQIEIPQSTSRSLEIGADSYVRKPDAEEIQRKLENSNVKDLTVLVQIGRNIADEILEKGVNSLDKEKTTITFDSEIRVNGTIRFDAGEVPIIVEEIVKHVQALLSIDSGEKVRVILGGTPVQLAIHLSKMLTETLGQNEKNRLLITLYNQLDQQFFDSSF